MLNKETKEKLLRGDIWTGLPLMNPDYSGWNGQANVFGDLVKRCKPPFILEVGTWKGQSCFTMLDAALKEGLDTDIICVDTWLGSIEMRTNNPPSTILSDEYASKKWLEERDLKLVNGYPTIYHQFLSNCVHRGYSSRVIPLPQTSVAGYFILREFRVHPNMIYLDASHDYEDFTRDINLYWDLLQPGGVIFGDDYNSWWGVERGVNEFVLRKGLTLEVFSLLKGWGEVFQQTYWVLQKPLV